MKSNYLILSCLLLLSSIQLLAQTTSIPDNNFENYLETHDASGNVVAIGNPLSMGNGIANDNLVTTANISLVTSLDVSNKGISDLTGIAGFTALESLVCNTNNLTSIDVSTNTALTILDCASNNLTALDVSANTSLELLYCGDNSLSAIDISTNTSLIQFYCNDNTISSLDVSTNTALTQLYCFSNTISTLDVSSNLALEELYCYSNMLTALDLGINTALTWIECNNNSLTYLDIKNGNNINLVSFNATNNAGLTCIQVDDAAYMNTNWSSGKDAAASFNEKCYTYVPDDNFEQALIDLAYDTVLDNYVLTSNINTITSLDINNKAISDLTGIEDFLALENLRCDYNNLSTLNISTNIALISLRCNNNSLIRLNVKNGNNTNLTTFDATSNSSLSCIEVDDVTYMNSNWSAGKDAGASYGSDCETNIPDTNFEQALINLGHDTTLDGFILNSTISTITSLDVSNKGINDLTGIAGFTALESLVCNTNNLTSIDVSTNTALTTLDCASNSLTTLDVSANTSLELLYCGDNSLSAIDISTNTSLIQFYCNDNTISSLDVSTNTALTQLYCFSNTISTLDVSSNLALEELYCYSNTITALDLGINTALTWIECNNNSLTYLDIKNGNNINLVSFNATNNAGLTCIQVDDAAYMNTNWSSGKDAAASFNVSCPSLSFSDIVLNKAYKLYPNPVKDLLVLETNLPFTSITVRNLQGAIVLKTTTKEVDLSKIASGMYLVQITDGSNTVTKKVMKK